MKRIMKCILDGFVSWALPTGILFCIIESIKILSVSMGFKASLWTFLSLFFCAALVFIFYLVGAGSHKDTPKEEPNEVENDKPITSIF